MLRFDSFVEWYKLGYPLIIIILVFTLVKLLVFYISGFYKRYWQQASIDELGQLIVLSILIFCFNFILFKVLKTHSLFYSFPRSLPYIDTLISGILVGFTRLSIRLTIRYKNRGQCANLERTLIIGAGQAGITLAMDMQRNPRLGYNPVAFIDDDNNKIGLRVRGIDIVGNRNEILDIAIKYQIKRIVVAIPSASGKDFRNILDKCKSTNVKVQTLPSLAEIINGNVYANAIRDINIVDLLRRSPIETEISEVIELINGKRVLVTGAGGSIGSEICRQIFRFGPASLIMVGHGENSIFDICNEISKLNKINNGPDITIESIIADVRFPNRIESVFEKYKPQIVFHAAAHKHVPLMEENPVEAVTNNIIGTNNILNAAEKFHIDRFVMISTDKAVNPNSIMGASKRAAEILVMSKASKTKKPFVCVRFGNVLGSRGSVIPIFKKQIEKGGPIIVTHPEVKRFFMTIPEAVQLVLQATVIGKGGEIFVLDMGEPIKIVDLAKDMIRLSGLNDFEIPIIYSGLRQGEKIFEELFIKGENYKPTKHKKILIAENASQFIPSDIESFFNEFLRCQNSQDEYEIREIFKRNIPEFTNNEKPLAE